MAAGNVNKVILVGNLGADPEIRFTPNGTQVASVRLATDDDWTDNRGQRRRRTEWHRLVMWRRFAEIAGQYLGKGSKIRVEGRLHTRNWEDVHRRRHCVTEIVVTDLRFIDAAGGPGELDMKYGREEETQLELETVTRPAAPPATGRSDYSADDLPF